MDLSPREQVIGDRYRPAIPQITEVYCDGKVYKREGYEIEHGLRELLNKLDLFAFPLDLFSVIAVLLDTSPVPVDHPVDNTKKGRQDRDDKTGKDPRIGKAQHRSI